MARRWHDEDVRPDRPAWLLSLPIALAGCLAAHVAAYAVAEPSAHERAHLLARSGHGYLSHLPLVAAVLAATTLVALAWAVRQAARRRRGQCPALLFALLPPLAFTLQEHLERLVETGGWPTAALAEPTFVLGLLLQAPFALLAWVVARTLLRAAEALGVALVRRRDAVRRLPALLSPALVTVPLRRPAPMHGGQRAPPLLARTRA